MVTIDEYDGEATVGDPVNVTALIENIGEIEDTQDIRFRINGDEFDVLENLALTSDQNETISFVYENGDDDAPEFETTVQSNNDSDTRTVMVTERAPAFFSVTNNNVSSEVFVGDSGWCRTWITDV